ncbi:hypothetical protein ACOMHN_059939 [Nucella lapillus]
MVTVRAEKQNKKWVVLSLHSLLGAVKGSLWPDLQVMPIPLQSGQVPWTQSLENCEDEVSLEGLLAGLHVESSVLATHWSSAG